MEAEVEEVGRRSVVSWWLRAARLTLEEGVIDRAGRMAGTRSSFDSSPVIRSCGAGDRIGSVEFGGDVTPSCSFMKSKYPGLTATGDVMSV